MVGSGSGPVRQRRTNNHPYRQKLQHSRPQIATQRVDLGSCPTKLYDPELIRTIMKDNKNTKAKLSDPVVEEQELDDDVNAASKGIEPGSNKDRRSGFPFTILHFHPRDPRLCGRSAEHPTMVAHGIYRSSGPSTPATAGQQQVTHTREA